VEDHEGICERCKAVESWLYGQSGLNRMLGLHGEEHSLKRRAPATTAADVWVDQPNQSLLIR